MEDIQAILSFISTLITSITYLLNKIKSKAKKKELKTNIIQSLLITSFFMMLIYFSGLINIEPIKKFSENFFILYILVFLGVVDAKLISNLIIRVLPFNGNDFVNFLRAVILIGLFVICNWLQAYIIFTNVGGVNVKFTEDVSAQFVVKDTVAFKLIYNVKIPKDTVVNLNGDDIRQIDNLIQSGNVNIKLFNEENVILLKKSKKILFKTDTQLYFVQKKLIPNSAIPKIELNYDINKFNEQLYTVSILPETKLSLTKDTDVVLLKDTKVEIYENKYKYFVSGLLILISILTPSYVIATDIKGRIKERKIKRLLIMLKKIMEMK